MVEKPRYQVFVSSTYADLRKERAEIFDLLMKYNHIPAGMEIFPAFDDDTLEYIKRVIDQSDHYVLIIAGRYGSISSDGLSFTEKEYDYAVFKKIPVLAFIHGNPDDIPVGKTDKDPAKEAMLRAFIEKVKQGRIVQFWRKRGELSNKVMAALSQTMAQKPGIGWVRGDIPANVDVLAEINELRKLNEKQVAQIEQQTTEIERLKSALDPPEIPDLAPLDREFVVHARVPGSKDPDRKLREYPFTWAEILGLIGPAFLEGQSEYEIQRILENTVWERYGTSSNLLNIFNEDLQTIKFHLMALGLLKTFEMPPHEDGYRPPGLILTERGKRTFLEVKAVRATSDLGAPEPPSPSDRRPAMAGAGRRDDLDDEIPF